MATTTSNYGTLVSHTITNTLANGIWYQTATIDNGTIKAMWAEVFITATTNTSVGSTAGTVDVYMAPSVDGGTDFAGGASGTEGVYLPTNADGADMQFIGKLPADALETTARTYKKRFVIHDVPEDFALVVENNTGQALASSGNTLEVRLHKYDTA